MLLLDSIIYARQPQPTGLRQRVAVHDVAVSMISQVEVSGFTGLDADKARFFPHLVRDRPFDILFALKAGDSYGAQAR